jgi:hypothetical protein
VLAGDADECIVRGLAHVERAQHRRRDRALEPPGRDLSPIAN